MLMSRGAMSGAAGQVRSIDGNLLNILNNLVAEGVWSGPDANRFAQDWHDQVRSKLINAAGNMERITFEPLA